MFKNTNYTRLANTIMQPAFIVINFLGIILLIVSVNIFSSIWNPIMVTIGSTLITVGVSLPIALYYQTKANNENFDLLKSCDKAGIENIFISRKQDNDKLRHSIEEASEKTTKNVFLNGIAFNTVFSPNMVHTVKTNALLNDPTVQFKVLILNPSSDAARRRAEIEKGGVTINDINSTLDWAIVSRMQERISFISDEQIKDRIHSYDHLSSEEQNSLLRKLKRQLQFEVKLYDSDPIAFIMGFDESLFTEQYHLGRPDGLVPFGGCIGKYLPVIQYRLNSYGYLFLKSHFDFMWNTMSQDITEQLIEKAVRQIP